MRKFTKYSLIAGCGLILVGVVITAAASTMGANPNAIGNFFRDRFHLPRHEYHHDDYEVVIGETTVTYPYVEDTLAPTMAETIPAEEFSAYDPANEPVPYTVLEMGDHYFSVSYPMVEYMEIQIRDGSVELVPVSDLEEIVISSDSGFVENIRYRDHQQLSKLSLTAGREERYQIQVPDRVFYSLEVENHNGSFVCDAISASEVELHAANGEIWMNQVSGDKLEIECANGTVEWTCDETIPLDIEVDCANGNVVLHLPGDRYEEGSLGYEVECSNGVVELPTVTLSENQEIQRQGDPGQPQLELEVANGNISVKMQ